MLNTVAPNFQPGIVGGAREVMVQLTDCFLRQHSNIRIYLNQKVGDSLVKLVGTLRGRQFLVVGITASLVIQLPLRCFQVEAYIRPFAETSEAIRASKVEIVGIKCSRRLVLS